MSKATNAGSRDKALIAILALTIGVLAGVAIGRRGAGVTAPAQVEREIVMAVAPERDLEPTDSRAPSAPPQSERVAVVRSGAPDGGVAAAAAAGRAAADRAIGVLLRRVRQQSQWGSTGPEELANEQNYYVEGLIDAALILAPEREPELRSAIEAAQCSATTEAESVLLSHALMRFPQHATTRGLACALRSATEEDVVLASVLDVYRVARLPPTPEWEAWRARARDPSIQRRFRDIDEEARERRARLSE